MSGRKAAEMKIALVTTHPPSKGTLNEYAYHFVRCLRQKPEVTQVDLLVEELPDGQSYDLETAGVAVQVHPCWQVGAWNNPWRIVQTVRQVKPDVVFFNIQFASFGQGKVASALGLLTPILVRWAGFLTVVLLHNIVETVDLKSAGYGTSPLIQCVIKFFGQIITHLILRAHLVTFTIPKYVELISQKYRADNIILAPHGAFDDQPEPLLESPDGPLRIMTFGKFGTYKRVEVLLQAFQQLQAEARWPLELVIAGGDSPNTPGYLASVAQHYQAAPNIQFAGYIPEGEVARLFGEAAVVVFPYSSTTGSSGVLHQAGSYGKAVVLPKLGDFAELVKEEGYVGEFFEPENPASLSRAIARLLADPERRRRQGLRNYRAASGLPMVEVVDWYLIHVERMLATQRHSSGEWRLAVKRWSLIGRFRNICKVAFTSWSFADAWMPVRRPRWPSMSKSM
jgi:glycosyltransferase involved in cell wall biosynthesis